MTRELLFVDDQWCRPEDQPTIRAAFGDLLRRDEAYIFHYETAEEGVGRYGVPPVMERLKDLPGISAVILDILFGDPAKTLGLEILAEIRLGYPLLPVIIMTTAGRDIGILERAMELGATEYMVKTPSRGQLEEVLATYVEDRGESTDYAIWGNSEAVRSMRAEIARVSAADLKRVLVVGESGSGKELVARSIHRQGWRRDGPFVPKNCAYASIELLDSDLFGHERGAFTGAERFHKGLLEASDKGVLFLDEISSMPHELQGKLLRVVETGSFERLGSRDSRTADFQLISATNLDPVQLVSSGRLRQDLFYRLSEHSIRVPPLRERPGDIEILAKLFLGRGRSRRQRHRTEGFPAERFSESALRALQAYDWPGNVRQLRNVVSQSSFNCRECEIELEHLPHEIVLAATAARDIVDSKGSTAPEEELDSDPNNWPRIRLRHELELAVAAKERIMLYKGRRWKAEFMRLMYPECRAQNAKGFSDLVRRLTRGPWGSTSVQSVPELAKLLQRLVDS